MRRDERLFFGTTEELGEKVHPGANSRERHPAGAKALDYFVAVTARGPEGTPPCPCY
jgi:hypothetical protein